MNNVFYVEKCIVINKTNVIRSNVSKPPKVSNTFVYYSYILGNLTIMHYYMSRDNTKIISRTHTMIKLSVQWMDKMEQITKKLFRNNKDKIRKKWIVII